MANVARKYKWFILTNLVWVAAIFFIAADYHDDKPYPIEKGKTTVIGGVYDDTSTDSVDENDTGSVRITSDRQLMVKTSGGAGMVDDAAFTPATSYVSMSGYFVDETSPDTADEGDGGAARMSASRIQYVAVVDKTGTNKMDAVIDDDEIDNCDDLAASSEQYTLPTANDVYVITVTGNCASILCGSNPTATTAKNGHFIKVCDGMMFEGRLAGTKCAHIAPSAAGEICYVQRNSAL